MTTDLQRMHQDEFLSALRSGGYTQVAWRLFGSPDECCVRGLIWRIAPLMTDDHEWLGISEELMSRLIDLNNGGEDGWENDRAFGRGHLTFDEIADFIKEERDNWNGDLSEWKPS